MSRTELRHSADARRGTAVVTFTVDGSDPYDAEASIRFADGATQQLEMDALNVMAPASRSWRLDLGSTPSDPSAPSAVSAPS